MKKITTIAAALMMMLAASAQLVPTQLEDKPNERTISVSGAAEKEVVPDEIYVNFEMDAAKSKTGFDMDSTRGDFLLAAKKAAVADEDVSIAGYEFYDTEWYRWRKIRTEEETSVTFSVKFSNAAQINKFIGALNKKRIRNIYVAKTAYSKSTELRKELKIQALKAAKEKAEYLCESIGEKATRAQSIKEMNDNGFMPFAQSQYSNTMMKADGSGATDFKKIKLRYEMEVVFMLQ